MTSPIIIRNPFQVGSTSNTSHGPSVKDGSGGSQQQAATDSSASGSGHVPQLQTYAQTLGGDFSGSASNSLPINYEPQSNDLLDAQVGLSQRPAARQVQQASNVSDVSADVFAMACAEALAARQGNDGMNAFASYYSSFNSPALQQAMTGFVNNNLGSSATGTKNGASGYSPTVLQAGKSAYPGNGGGTITNNNNNSGGTITNNNGIAPPTIYSSSGTTNNNNNGYGTSTTNDNGYGSSTNNNNGSGGSVTNNNYNGYGSGNTSYGTSGASSTSSPNADAYAPAARDYRNKLWNMLGGTRFRDAMWNKFQLDGLLPNVDGTLPPQKKVADDAQSCFAGLNPDEKQQYRNDMYNLLQNTSYNSVWNKLDSFGLLPPATNAGPQTITQGRNIGTKAAQQLNSGVYNALANQPYGAQLWKMMQTDHILPASNGAMGTPSDLAGDGQSLYGSMSNDDKQAVRNNLYNALQKLPIGDEVWSNLNTFNLIPGPQAY